MRTRTILSIAFGVIVFAGILYAGWRKNGPNQFEAPFQPGGQITLDLSIGGFTIKGTSDNKIRVEVDPSDISDVHSQISVSGNLAKVALEGPSNNFQATIYVPQRTDLKVFQSIGELHVVGVEGNKDVGLNIGKIHLEVPDPEKVKAVDAAVKIGNVHAAAWHRGHGGFFPSFRAGGQGSYLITANLDIGDIELGD